MPSAFENRLRRNVARLRPRFEREGVEAWRAYDRDVPEFPWSVDRYGGRVLACEYLTPVARRRGPEARRAERDEVVQACANILEIDTSAVVVRERAPLETGARTTEAGRPALVVREGACRFLVDVEAPGDTGLFLDHRPARRRLLERAQGRRVLNLFCYTGSFSVAAGVGGAAATTSVDLSKTYLDWAAKNLALNGLEAARHRFVREDVFEFLRRDPERYDFVVLDPPTLSRSAAGRSFDVQKAHVRLIQGALEWLAPGGEVWFSTNYRQFQLDERALAGVSLRETTAQTTPPDFRAGVHRSWVASRAGGAAGR